jgi:hypothetical protein
MRPLAAILERFARAAALEVAMRAREPVADGFVDPERVLGSVFVGPSLALVPAPDREATTPPFEEPYTSTEGWARYNRHYWLEHWEDFLEFFFGRCFTEPHPTKQREDCVGWSLETTPQVVIAMERAPCPDEATLTGWCGQARDPVKVNLLVREFVVSLGGRTP